MRLRLALLTLVVATLAGCSVRERANPFDPHNRDTSGRPIGFEALAGNQRVDLHWQSVAGQGLVGFQLWRRVAGEADYSPLTGVMPLPTTEYHDLAVANGVNHSYRLYYVFDGGIGTRPAEDLATPGPVRPWMVDGLTGRLARLTADGRHVAFSGVIASGPSAVAVDSISGRVWISDTFGQQVLSFNPANGVTVTIPGLDLPTQLAVDPADSSAWVCDESRGAVYRFDSHGDQTGAPVEGLVTPTGVAVDSADRSIWICERGRDRVLRREPDGSARWLSVVTRPSRVALDPLTREGWVTSRDARQVYRVTDSGRLANTFGGFGGPIGLAVDSRRGRIWIADTNVDQLVALRRDGSVEFRVSGLPAVRDVAIDIETGEAWAALAVSGEVVRVSPGGTVLQRLGGFLEPFGISVDPGGRRSTSGSRPVP